MPNTDALKSLHTVLIDAENGYEEAIKDADEPEMKALFETMRSLHQQAHGDVHAILRSKGEHPDESGSFMSLVHETVISVRSAVTGLGRPSLASFSSGEERIVTAYDDAIQESSEDAPVADILRQRRNQLLDMTARMKNQAT